MKLKRPLKGSETGSDVRMVQRALNKWVRPSTEIPENGHYDQRTIDRMVGFQLEQNIKPATGNMGQRTLDRLTPYFDAYGRWRYRLYMPPVPTPIPALGPCIAGGKSVLDHDLTHATSGLSGYPAFDDGWYIGVACIAPEDMVVTKQSSAQGGDAFYARGKTCDWWFGHVHRAPATGTRFKKGERFALIGADHPRPHLHVGINTYRLIGRELIHHTDYTHGAPKIGVQLAAALA